MIAGMMIDKLSIQSVQGSSMLSAIVAALLLSLPAATPRSTAGQDRLKRRMAAKQAAAAATAGGLWHQLARNPPPQVAIRTQRTLFCAIILY